MAVETRLALTLTALAACVSAGAAQPAPAGDLKVHLPRVQQVPIGKLTLGQVCIVFGDDQAVAAAEKVPLCRSPFSGEKMRVDRNAILGRLAANGFDRRRIRFSGSRHVVLSLNEQEVGASRIVAAAAALLDTKHPALGESLWRLAGQIEAVNVKADSKVRLTPKVLSASEHSASVRVDVAIDGQAVKSRVLAFSKEYLWRQARAKRAIAQGAFLTEANTAVETVYRPRPQEDWRLPYGKQARGAIRAGCVIAPSLLTSVQPALVFERDATVQIRVKLGEFTLMAKGLALTPGRVGQTVKVQNVDSRKILTARVCADGTVEPVLEEMTK